MKTLAGTGHRPDKLGGYVEPNPIATWVKARIRDVLHDEMPNDVVSGMALGFDMWLAEVAIELDVPVIAAIPFEGQAIRWPIESEERYNRILRQCHRQHVVSPGAYAAWKMQKRNEWMVDRCDVLLACWDGTTGGTANCLRYAEKRGTRVVRVDPREAT